MKLTEYLKEIGIPLTVFARRIGVSTATIHNLVREKRDPRLSIAVKIEDATKNRVTCRELLPDDFFTKDVKKTITKKTKKRRTK